MAAIPHSSPRPFLSARAATRYRSAYRLLSARSDQGGGAYLLRFTRSIQGGGAFFARFAGGVKGNGVYLIRFAAVGLLGTLLDMALFAVLHLALGLAALPANTLSYSAGIVNNFLLHRRWTYANEARRPALGQFARFAAISLSALGLNTLVVTLLAPALGTLLPDWAAALAAKGFATGLGMAWNFLANHLWTFRGLIAKNAAPG